MRSALQRQIVLDELARAWAAQPYMRLCQLIVNATGRADPFYVEDDALMAGLDSRNPWNDVHEPDHPWHDPSRSGE